MRSDYHFVTVWRVRATVEEVQRVLADGTTLPHWWPAVYLGVRVIEDPGPQSRGVGAAAELHTTGWLPYTLRWVLRITEPVTETGFALTAEGDLEGTGRWTFTPQGPDVVITYDWRVRASKPLLRRMTWLLRPVFEANHHWAMARGEESLRLELLRRRAVSERERAQVPAPPPPTFPTLRLAAPRG